jgi:hypothetical protein
MAPALADAVAAPAAGLWLQARFLLWKHALVAKRRWRSTLVQLLAPVIVSLLLWQGPPDVYLYRCSPVVVYRCSRRHRLPLNSIDEGSTLLGCTVSQVRVALWVALCYRMPMNSRNKGNNAPGSLADSLSTSRLPCNA